MGRFFRALFLSGAGCVAALLTSCADLGNGSEITNGVMSLVSLHGVAVAHGKPCAGVLVTAFRTDYIPLWGNSAPSVCTVSDSAGNFSIPLFNAVAYNLLLSDTVAKRGAFRKNVVADSGSCGLGGVELDSLGAIDGTTFGDTAKTHTQYIFVAGSPFVAKVAEDHGFTIAELPAQTYDLSVMISLKPGLEVVLTVHSVPGPTNSDKPVVPAIIGSVNVFAGSTTRADALNVGF